MNNNMVIKNGYGFMRSHYPIIIGMIIFYVFLLFWALDAISQNPVNEKAIAVVNNENKTITSFTTTSYGEKIYLKWLVQKQKKDCLFFVERSDDGKNYEILDLKEGYGTSIDVPLLYCYIDEKPIHKTSYYKISTFNFDDIDSLGTVKVVAESPVNTGTKKDKKVKIIYYGSAADEQYNVSLIDLNGNIVDSKKVSNAKKENSVAFSSDQLNSGIYLMSISNDTKTKLKKVIIP